LVSLIWTEQAVLPKNSKQIVTLLLKTVKELTPRCTIVEPLGPPVVELILNVCGEVPQSDTACNRREAFSASDPGDLKHQPRLSEVVRLWESAAHELSTLAAKNAVGIPPTRPVHFSVTGDDKAKLEQSIEV